MRLEQDLEAFGSLFVDTAPVIYYIEGHPAYGPITRTVFEHFVNNGVRPYSSVLMLTEVLVKPVQVDDVALTRLFSNFIRSGHNFRLIDINPDIAEIAGYLRGNHQFLKTIDALQIASAIHVKAEVFVTNDEKLRKISGLKIMVLKDYL